MRGFRLQAAVATLGLLLAACAAGDSTMRATPTASESPTASATASESPTAATPSPVGLVPCESFPRQTYVNRDYGFSATCPSGFLWHAFGDAPTGWLFMARTVDGKQSDTHPNGQILLGVRAFDSDTLRHWVDRHAGNVMDASGAYLWNNVSGVRDIRVGGVTAIAFDYIATGAMGEGPMDSHAVALVLKGTYVLFIYWWAYSDSGYGPTIGSVADSVVASIELG